MTEMDEDKDFVIGFIVKLIIRTNKYATSMM
jgi:hypothetical protein